MFKLSPETKAQGNGVGLGALIALAVCYFIPLSIFGYGIFVVVSMGLLGLVFAAIDAGRANAGRPPVSLRNLFIRGLAEAAFGFVLLLAFTLLSRVT